MRNCRTRDRSAKQTKSRRVLLHNSCDIVKEIEMDANRALTAILPPPSSKFTLDEWHLNNQFRYQCSETQQKLADRLLAEATRACESATEIVKANKEETDHRLVEKINDIEFRKKELSRIRKDIVLEIDNLSTYRERIADALKSVKRNALAICKNCLVAREHRLGIDLVHDNVERELLKECKIIQTTEGSLERILEETHEQIRRLKATLYNIDHDIDNKKSNLHIDCRNKNLKKTDFDSNICHDVPHLDISITTLNEWELQTNSNVIDANKEVNSAKRLRCYIDTIIKQTIDGLNEQKNVTNEAFRQRIEQVQEAKTKLELLHSEIVKQVAAMSSSIEYIKKSIADKEVYMVLVQKRLGNRRQRPGLELTQDLVEANLIKEINELRRVTMNLQQTLCEAEASLRYLLQTQVQLEEDINIKTNTLKIDDVECMVLRQSMDYHAY